MDSSSYWMCVEAVQWILVHTGCPSVVGCVPWPNAVRTDVLLLIVITTD